MRNLRLLFLVGLAAGFISEKLLVSSQPSFSTADDLYLEGQASGNLPIDDDDDDSEDEGSGSGSGNYAFNDFTDNMLRRISNFSRTTVSKEMVPSQPQPTADSRDNPPTTAADSKDPSTTVKDTETTPFIFPGGDKEDEESTGLRSTSLPPSETTATKFGKDIIVSKDADKDNSLDRWDVSATTEGRDDIQIKEFENEILAKDGRGSRMYEMDSPKEVTSESLWERTEVLAAVIACGVVGFLCAVFLLLLLVYRMKKKDEGSYDLGDTKLSSTIYHKAPTKEFYA
ncbi:syndecan-2-like [Micropterus dolomieu]|uniref:syndecan-2-like n=1 Tax=Micropterus dolomieu TaxID=147949 RepID=UPI001E8D02FA|nr:syndecan-2-like [Micropterus dolomieu]XP_045901469.1 syndecan-2-like [Micropterus dolomieu]